MKTNTTIADLYYIMLNPRGSIDNVLDRDGTFWLMLKYQDPRANKLELPFLVVLEPNEIWLNNGK